MAQRESERENTYSILDVPNRSEPAFIFVIAGCFFLFVVGVAGDNVRLSLATRHPHARTQQERERVPTAFDVRLLLNARRLSGSWSCFVEPAFMLRYWECPLLSLSLSRQMAAANKGSPSSSLVLTLALALALCVPVLLQCCRAALCKYWAASLWRANENI